MPFYIVKDDITNLKVDAIVNSTSTDGVFNGSTERTIMDQGGKELYQDRVLLGEIGVTESKITPAYNLLCKFVVHTVTPYYDGSPEDEGLLKLTFINILHKAKASKCESIAIPLIATKSRNYPKRIALNIAEDSINEFLVENEMDIYLVLYDDSSYLTAKHILKDINLYLKDNFVDIDALEYHSPKLSKVMTYQDSYYSDLVNLDNKLDDIDKDFKDTLLELIFQTGEKNSTIYKKANIDKKLFAKIKNDDKYQPSKRICLSFAFALKLNIEETEDFISRAGYTLSNSIKFDLIIKYCIENHIYNVFDVNEILHDYDQRLLGSSME